MRRAKASDVKQIPSVLSIGYEKQETSLFLQNLADFGTQALVDVRESAFSRRLDFRKQKLTSLLNGHGIEYFHLRKAGNPYRKESVDDIQRCLGLYRDYLKNEPNLLKELGNELRTITQKYPKIAILCYEQLPSECHRTILIDMLTPHHFKCFRKEV